MFQAYITCVLGPWRRTQIRDLKGYLIKALMDARPGVKDPILAARSIRHNFVEQAKNAAGRARSLVSAIFVHPQNGPEDIQFHPNAGKYAITTPGSFCDAWVGHTS